MLAERTRRIAVSPTMKVASDALRLKAEGVDVVDLGAGEPDFPTPAPIVEAAIAAARDPKMHRYTPAAGLPELPVGTTLREALAYLVAERQERLVVTDRDGSPLGIASREDVLR